MSHFAARTLTHPAAIAERIVFDRPAKIADDSSDEPSFGPIDVDAVAALLSAFAWREDGLAANRIRMSLAPGDGSFIGTKNV